MKKIGEIEALHEHPAYHTTILLRCKCGNCGRGFYLASPDGDEDAKGRWRFVKARR